jgi:hypothetical protein
MIPVDVDVDEAAPEGDAPEKIEDHWMIVTASLE